MLAKYVERLVGRDEHRCRRPRPFATVEEAIEDIRAGRMVVVCDDEDRENEGDLMIAAQFATPEAINFMAKEGRGLICLALTAERCDELGLDLMAAKNESPFETAFTGLDRGARGRHDRHLAPPTARARSRSRSTPTRAPRDLVQPGHVFPLKAKAGGVLERTGQTEAAVDLARLAGLIPAGVICEIMNDDGTMARVQTSAVLRPARAEDDHGRRPDRLPAPPRQARRAGGRDARCRPPSASSRAVGYRSLVDDKHHVAHGQGRRRRARATCWSACTPSA